MRRTALLLLVLAAPLRAAEFVPVFDAQLMLGQLFQDAKASSWQGNANLQFTPAVKLSEQWGLIPTYAAAYQGTKSVTELGGGGQLFQDSQSHSLQAKAVYTRDALKLKPQLGLRYELLRETSDEGWGDGLFDYRKYSAGVEGEYGFTDSVKGVASFDYYLIRFPNYRSLESGQVQAGLGREQAQARTLDSRNISGTLGGFFPLPFEGGTARLWVNITDRAHPEQHVVNRAGQLEAQTRRDALKTATAMLYYGRTLAPRLAGLFSLRVGLGRARSNQNHYDPELNLFTREYYSYDERQIQPRLAVVIGQRKVECAVSYLRIDRNYLGRQAQDAAGSYIDEAVSLDQDSFQVQLTVPLRSGLRLLAQTAVSNSRSNVTYEKSYKYNYTIASHLVGLSYSY